ncbi:MAG: protein phosphatase 2C domain-containing protein [Acidobacteriota bacterium]|nr:protein phosphatase 2C domain-containing protein [Acidobacteriota bacterium]
MTNTTTSGFISASISDKGLSEKRPVNEDSYLELVDLGLFAVADGVGGAQAGDVASQMAMEVLFEAFSHPHPGVDTEELMEMAIQRANQSIFQMARDLPSLDMMATTIVALHLDNGVATIGHAGDSRLYRLDSRGNLFRETQDHSVVEEEVRAGRMTVAQAANHPSRNVISRALGAEDTVEVDMKTIRFEPGTSFLLCSDGVTRHIQDHELREILLGNRSPVDVCNEIKNLCYGRGAEDNLTAVVIKTASDSETALLDDDESTIPGIRTATGYDNFQSSNGAFKTQTEAETDELPPIILDEPETQPLEPPETMSFPATKNSFDDTLADEHSSSKIANPGEITLPQKLENERLREKVNSAAPLIFEPIEQPKSRTSTGKVLLWLFLILFAGLVFAVVIYFFMWSEPQALTSQGATTSEQASQFQSSPISTLADSGLSAAEVTEFRTFERVRRTVDKNPVVAPNAAAPVTSADFYLRGRAFLQTGDYEAALEALKTAQEMLPDSRDVDRETLRVDIAFGLAAVSAMANNPNPKKVLGELISERKQAAKTTASPTR